MTQDIDIIIAPTLSTLLEFIRHLPQDAYYVDEAAARDALSRRSMFNVWVSATFAPASPTIYLPRRRV